MSTRTRRPLFLYEELLLLALREREGKLPACAGNLRYALGGALLAELLRRERVRVVRRGRKELVEPTGRTRLGEPLLDEALRRIRDARRPARASTWVSRLAGTKALRHRVAGELCALGVLRAGERRFLLLFSRRIYPERDPEPERELVAKLREAIFGDGREVEARTVALLSLAHASGLLRSAFDRRELKRRKAHVRRLVEADPVGRAAKQAIEAAQAAAAVAVT